MNKLSEAVLEALEAEGATFATVLNTVVETYLDGVVNDATDAQLKALAREVKAALREAGRGLLT